MAYIYEATKGNILPPNTPTSATQRQAPLDPDSIDLADSRRVITNALISVYKRRYLSTEHIKSVQEMAAQNLSRGRAVFERNPAWTLDHQSSGSFDSQTKKALTESPASCIVLTIHTDLGGPRRRKAQNYSEPHFAVVLYAPKLRRVYSFDTIQKGCPLIPRCLPQSFLYKRPVLSLLSLLSA
ncbi:hypothetical protein GGS23DRAFT_166547 [Durotheca rogersii]|uniref:uncharacterized protein n=1 Tax=Durotheca rogersii TaxID=419775 RepID=UPI00221F10C3|nr:uncharacterized protein GGS23DRAFT_166547 [Durotheca rogersii]KAI5867222.1 hypothetical protein GGS23DRAFT_166547 [Durotheca rogersii]